MKKQWLLITQRPRVDQDKDDPELIVALHGPFKDAEAFAIAMASGGCISWGCSTKIVTKTP